LGLSRPPSRDRTKPLNPAALGLECAVTGVDLDETLLFTEVNLTLDIRSLEDIRSIVLLLATEVVEVIMGEVECSTISQPRIVEVLSAPLKLGSLYYHCFLFLSWQPLFKFGAALVLMLLALKKLLLPDVVVVAETLLVLQPSEELSLEPEFGVLQVARR